MSRVIACLIVAAGLVGAFIEAPVAEAAELESIERVSLRDIADERDDADVSPDGRYVAFVSSASNIVPEDRQTNSLGDVFLYDVQTETMTRVSVDASGSDANNSSTNPSVSSNGRFVAFQANANDLVADDGNGATDVFVRDMDTGVTSRVSVDTDGADADADSRDPAITPDGRYVVFVSSASDLVDGAGGGIFVRDLQTGTTVAVGGGTLPTISDDGQHVAYDGGGALFVYDLNTQTHEEITIDYLATEGPDGISMRPRISGDGQFVVFESEATNLVEGDTNGMTDIFVRDLVNDTTERVSLNSSGEEANGFSRRPSVSGDGRYVAFGSFSSNLAPGVLQGVFVRDRLTGTTTAASTSPTGVPAGDVTAETAISDDGRYVVFDSTSRDLTLAQGANDEDVFRKDTVTGAVALASPDLGFPMGYAEVNAQTNDASISADGSLVAFVRAVGQSPRHIEVRNRALGTTVTVSRSPEGDTMNNETYGPALSADGAFVAFTSQASNAAAGFDGGDVNQIYLRDIGGEVTHPVSVNMNGGHANAASWGASISGDGRYVAFASEATDLVPDDDNGQYDVFVRDMDAGVTTRVAMGDEPMISVNGRYVVFSSDANDLVANDGNDRTDVFVADLQTSQIIRVSVDADGLDSDGFSLRASISGDGRRVAFISTATDLVTNGPTAAWGDVYVRDLDTGVTELVSAAISGHADSWSDNPAISADGRVVVFDSDASNLTEEAIGLGGMNVYARDLDLDTMVRVSIPLGGGNTSNWDLGDASVSGDGRFVAFHSWDANLVPEDTNNLSDVFVAELTLEQPVPQCLGNPATVVGAGSISGTAGADVIVGSDGPDVINGLGGDDIVCGLGDNDQISGDAGADLMAGGAGDDTLTGGGSLDTVTYESSTSGVDVDLTAGTGSGDGTDTLASVESIRGSSHDDVIWGSGAANTLEGREGADELVGRGGNDIMLGGPGDDEISGMAGDDSLDGGEANDLCVQGTGAGTPVACEISAIPVTLGDASALEPDTGTTPAVFTVSIPIPTDTPITMTASTQDGSALGGVDYTARTGVAVTIPGGQTSREVNVQVRGDYTPEPNESFTLLLSGVVGGSLADGSGTATIEDEDPPESLPLVSIGDVEVIESNRATYTVQLAVSLSAPFPAPVTVDFTTVPGGTATAGLDYNEAAPTQVRFAPGVTERVARITLRGDSEIEPNETVRVALSNLVNANLGDGEADITLVDDDTVPTLSVTPVSVIEGTGGPTTAVFTFELDRPFGAQARVRYATADGTALAPGDYTQVGNTILRFDPGVISQQVVIQVNGDTEIEMDETFTLNLSNLVNLVSPGSSVQGTILNDD